MNRVLDDLLDSADLFPFSLTRPARDIRLGILTIGEKWELAQANPKAISDILSLVEKIRFPWDLFRLNGEAIRIDFALVTAGRQSAALSKTVQTINPGEIFIEPGADLEYCTLNASGGPIYIGRSATVMEGAAIRGPFALGESAVVKMGARIYGATTIGPHSTAGGEIKNSILSGFSNKGHDGYLGDSVIGEWCNLGAGTSNSNLKNNAQEIRVWSQARNGFVPAGSKCGLLMGDYSRSAINTSFNTGTVVGVCSHVFREPGEGLTPKLIPSFSWGQGMKYDFDKAVRDIASWKKLKGRELTSPEIQTLKEIYTNA